MNIFLAAGKISTKKAGIGNYVFHLVKGLADLDQSNHYYVFCGTHWRREKRENMSLFGTAPQNFTFSMPRIPSNYFKLLMNVAANTTGKILFRGIDLYHETDNVPFPAPRRVKVVNTIHDLSRFLLPQIVEFDAKKMVDYWNRNKKAMTEVDRIITVSNHSKRDICEYLRVPEEKVTVVYNGISNLYRPLKPEILIKELQRLGLRDPYILYAGTITPKKNVGGLLRAYSLLSERRRDIPPLFLVGSKGWGSGPILKLIEELKISKQVNYMGYVSDRDLAVIYNGASIFMYPSFYEGFGFPPLEAMACGCPTIVSNVSSLPEVVGDAAELVDPKDHEEIACSIEKLLSDKAKQETMRQKGMARAQMFSWDDTVRKTLKLYEELA